MRGYYRVYEDGKFVSEHENLITTAGRRVIADYMAGIVPNWAGALAVGVGLTAASAADTRLEFEVARGTVKSKTVSYNSGIENEHLLLAKTTLDNDVAGYFYEMGLFSADKNGALGSSGSVALSTGDSTEEWQLWNGTAWVETTVAPNTVNSKIGRDAVAFETATSTQYRLTNLNLDLSDFAPADQFSFATAVVTGTFSALQVQFQTDESNYYWRNINSPYVTTPGYKISSFNKSDWVSSGAPDWSNINHIEFTTTGSGTLILDGIRAEERDLINNDYAMVSRTAPLTNPIVKAAGSIMEIEYYVDL